MALITLKKENLNGVGGLISKIVDSSDKLGNQLTGIKFILQGVASDKFILGDAIENISSSSKTEEEKKEEIKKLNSEIKNFVDTTVSRDNLASDEINKSKNVFYSKYAYLKPECEKGFFEGMIDGIKTVCNWCKEHYMAGLTILMVAVSIALLFVPGVGSGIWGMLIMGGCLGTILGAGFGGLAEGICNLIKGKSFWAGFEKGAFYGAIGGMIGGAIAGGLTGALGPLATQFATITSQMGIGAFSTGISESLVTTLKLLIENGTLKGGWGEILKSGLIGVLTGAILGGIMGKISYKKPVESSPSPSKTDSVISTGTKSDESKADSFDFLWKQKTDAEYLEILEDSRYKHLSLDEIKAIDKYAGAEYQNINNSLRVDEFGIPLEVAYSDNKKAIEFIKTALSKSELKTNDPLYRGCGREELGKIKDLSAEELIGKSFRESAFTSTSQNYNRALDFSDNVIMTIKNPEGCNALDISGVSRLGGEKEILFNVGQKFRITDAEEVGDMLYLEVEPIK